MTAPTQILLIDDHPLMRQGMRQLLELDHQFSVVGEASNGTTVSNLHYDLSRM
ncbi:Nitrate/nitrite response regulator protein narL [Mannheimia haemolytica]|uniref:Nitrate/nitrite response regulator protein narL n=1 Tax=Mannheimia haemolytica TaxID=75985 RepID=A0A378MVS0_MANHA|nr:Nitrate/nitrite response regulator protein narL [Mannheimia haemolytica]